MNPSNNDAEEEVDDRSSTKSSSPYVFCFECRRDFAESSTQTTASADDVKLEQHNSHLAANKNIITNDQPAGASGDSPLKPSMVQIAQVNHHNFLIRIFTDSSEENPRRFFFEPVVLLDPKSIIAESFGFLKQDFIRFTIKMWNQDLRSKVLERLRSLPSLANVIIQEDDVCVMPYEEVQLVCDPGTGLNNSIKLV